MAVSSINQPSGRAVTRSFNLPWSSGDDFRLSLIPISAGDRGSIPRGRDSFLRLLFLLPLKMKWPLKITLALIEIRFYSYHNLEIYQDLTEIAYTLRYWRKTVQ
ncbi:uncharacterized protein N7511_004658 [Penicillium nucicola]|uniref:uncharacterized protein n=1 Tax=Penicillium nucicola TaxID=1850975 RepID=UPI002544FA7C|nr:uncharacterized protein N7511_004658 [Penicillium nucicola]KAJ5767042.1 hypothetical protein N7511_004658 [Penicillium nucicola]